MLTVSLVKDAAGFGVIPRHCYFPRACPLNSDAAAVSLPHAEVL
uniref:Uncharacterized protein n=1 Tax=Anguilla anguilla TaxID=7936 RepID=A0A0E9SIP0_ANGAN